MGLQRSGLPDFRSAVDCYPALRHHRQAGAPVPADQLKIMPQTLLVSRFSLVLNRETRKLPVYELLVARQSPKLTQAQSATSPADGVAESSMQPGEGDLVCRNYSMKEFAEKLAGIPFRVDRAVVNKTGLPRNLRFQAKDRCQPG